MRTEQDGAQRRRKRERVDGGQQHRHRNGDCKLAEQFTGNARNERDRHEDRQQNQRDRDNRRCDFRHRALARFRRRKLGILFHYALDVLDHHDSVVDDDADGQHDGEQRDGVGGIADRLERNKCTNKTHRHGNRRNQCCTDVSEKQKDHQHHENESFEQSFLHFVHGVFHEDGRIVRDRPGQILGKALLQFGKLCSQSIDGIDRIAAGRLVDRDRGGVVAVEPRVTVKIGGAQFELRDIAQSQYRAIRIGPDDDIFKLFDGVQAALGLNIELQLLIIKDRSRADASDGSLHILRLNSGNNVVDGKI